MQLCYFNRLEDHCLSHKELDEFQELITPVFIHKLTNGWTKLLPQWNLEAGDVKKYLLSLDDPTGLYTIDGLRTYKRTRAYAHINVIIYQYRVHTF